MDIKLFVHGVKQEQIAMLEQIFSKLTKDGWIIPEWIDLLRKNNE